MCCAPCTAWKGRAAFCAIVRQKHQSHVREGRAPRTQLPAIDSHCARPDPAMRRSHSSHGTLRQSDMCLLHVLAATFKQRIQNVHSEQTRSLSSCIVHALAYISVRYTRARWHTQLLMQPRHGSSCSVAHAHDEVDIVVVPFPRLCSPRWGTLRFRQHHFVRQTTAAASATSALASAQPNGTSRSSGRRANAFDQMQTGRGLHGSNCLPARPCYSFTAISARAAACIASTLMSDLY